LCFNSQINKENGTTLQVRKNEHIFCCLYCPILLTCQMHSDYTVSAHDH